MLFSIGDLARVVGHDHNPEDGDDPNGKIGSVVDIMTYWHKWKIEARFVWVDIDGESWMFDANNLVKVDASEVTE